MAYDASLRLRYSFKNITMMKVFSDVVSNKYLLTKSVDCLPYIVVSITGRKVQTMYQMRKELVNQNSLHTSFAKRHYQAK